MAGCYALTLFTVCVLADSAPHVKLDREASQQFSPNIRTLMLPFAKRVCYLTMSIDHIYYVFRVWTYTWQIVSCAEQNNCWKDFVGSILFGNEPYLITAFSHFV